MRTLLPLLILLPLSAARAEEEAADPDGAIDGETAFEKAEPLLREQYLHPSAIEPERMLRSGVSKLELEGPDVLVREDGDRLTLRVGAAERDVALPSPGDVPAVFRELEAVVTWLVAARAQQPTEPRLTVREQARRLDPDALRIAALSGALDTIDRYSTVMAGDRLDDFNTRFSGELVGIGARISRRAGSLRIVKPFPDAPAGIAGLVADDEITHIDGVSTESMSVDDAVERIRGPEAVPVVLSVRRGGEGARRVFVIVRRPVLVPSVESEMLAGDVGLVRIDHFSRKTSEEFAGHADALARAPDGTARALKGLVVDLRGNQGGSMVHAARIVNHFVDRGVLVETEGRDGGPVRGLTHTVPARSERMKFGGPVIVLVDGDTASGSEIVAGGLKFLERGLVVGSQTYGKGTVQKVYTLSEDASLKLTVARYLLPGGAFINGVGVTPDVALGAFVLEPAGSSSPDALTEPAVAEGYGDGGSAGLDASMRPGLGRAPSRAGTNAEPALRLGYARVMPGWMPAAEPTPAAATAPGSPSEPGRAGTAGDAGDDRFNDMDLRIAWEILQASAPADRREALIERARQVVAAWAPEAASRLKASLAARGIAWTPGGWLDAAPAREAAWSATLSGPAPDGVAAELHLPEALAAGVAASARVVVTNRRVVPLGGLRALLESTSPSLHGLTFLLGDIAPGETRDAEVAIEVPASADDRIDEHRLYLVDGDGPLGGPAIGTAVTRGAEPASLRLRVLTRPEPQADGSLLLHATVQLGNDGVGDTGEVQVRFGDTFDESIERIERFVSVPALRPKEIRDGALTLRVRTPAGRETLDLRVRATDAQSGDGVTARITVPLGHEGSTDWLEGASLDWGETARRGRAPFPLRLRASAAAGLDAVEVYVERDKVFAWQPQAGAPAADVDITLDATLGVGPNRIAVRTLTREGVDTTALRWVYGDR
jgi:carboxyl-terminal processing protease